MTLIILLKRKIVQSILDSLLKTKKPVTDDDNDIADAVNTILDL